MCMEIHRPYLGATEAIGVTVKHDHNPMYGYRRCRNHLNDSTSGGERGKGQLDKGASGKTHLVN
jgi:hypothetical protein